MGVTKVAGVLILTVVALLPACERWSSSDGETKVPLTTAPGLAVPEVDQLAKKLELSLRYPKPGAKVYTREDGKWVEVKPLPVGRDFSAVVRSFDATQGMAYVELTYLQYNMPVVQIWHFDGNAWSDSVDPGIFVR
jgi:hypothetical protein